MSEHTQRIMEDAGTWQEFTVEDLAASERNSLVGGPFGSNLVSADYVESGIPVIRGQNMGKRWVEGPFAYVTEEKAQSLRANLARPGDIIFTQRGTLGQVSVVPGGEYGAYLLSQSQMKLTPDSHKADPLFLYYVLISSEQQEYVRQHAIQTGVPHTNLGILKKTPISAPPVKEQRTVASVLGAFDDKIELNRKMNEALEAMARALFKSWFVDFDPVRAKAEGRDTGLPAHIADLFPGALVESPLGPVPQGWDITTWGAVATLEYGKSLSGYNTESGMYPVYGTNGRIGTCSKPLCPYPGVILGRKGAYRGVHYSPSPFFAIDTAFYVAPKIPIELRWAYYELLRLDINSMDSGSAIPSTSREDFYNLPVVVPPAAVQQQFVRLLAPIWQQQEQNQKMSVTLTNLRDTLLPKLISGEIRVAREHCI